LDSHTLVAWLEIVSCFDSPSSLLFEAGKYYLLLAFHCDLYSTYIGLKTNILDSQFDYVFGWKLHAITVIPSYAYFLEINWDSHLLHGYHLLGLKPFICPNQTLM